MTPFGDLNHRFEDKSVFWEIKILFGHGFSNLIPRLRIK